MKALSKRIARLEQAEPHSTASLVVIYGEGLDAETQLTGVDGVDMPRLPGESVAAFLTRLEAHMRTEGRRALPVCFARYGDDDAPDAPPESDDTTVVS